MIVTGNNVVEPNNDLEGYNGGVGDNDHVESGVVDDDFYDD